MNNHKATFSLPCIYRASKESTGKILPRSTFVICVYPAMAGGLVETALWRC